MTYQTPCSDPQNDPSDWFISRDGKQYPDDELLDQDAVDAALASVELTAVDDGFVEAVDRSLEQAEERAKRDALKRRRKAKESCHNECYFRLQCLDIAIRTEQTHGTWGGYTEEELRELRREIARRRRRK